MSEADSDAFQHSSSTIPLSLATDLAIQTLGLFVSQPFQIAPLRRSGGFWRTSLRAPKLLGSGETMIGDDGLAHQYGSGYIMQSTRFAIAQCDCGRCKLSRGERAHFFKYPFQQRDAEQNVLQAVSSQYSASTAEYGIGLLSLVRFYLFCGERETALQYALESLDLQERHGKPDTLRYIDTLSLLCVLFRLTNNSDGANEASQYLAEATEVWFAAQLNRLLACGHSGNLSLVNIEFNTLST